MGEQISYAYSGPLNALVLWMMNKAVLFLEEEVSEIVGVILINIEASARVNTARLFLVF